MTLSRGLRSEAVRLVVFTAVLAVIAALAPAPWNPTDRDEYELVGRELVVPGCSSLHCFRKLVPIIVEHLPGQSAVKWKAYAVVTNALAAVAVHRLALVFGLTAGAAGIASVLTLLGFGSLYTLFDPHTADPFMFLLGPVLTLALLSDRTGWAAVMAAIGVFAKEFAAAPLWISAWADGMARRWGPMVRTAGLALSVTTLWIAFQLTLITAYDYTYGDNPSSRLVTGGYLLYWGRELGARTAIVALLTTYGALYLLVPAGMVLAPARLRQWTLASIPALAAFCYVQQADRAIWNFHFLATPLAALVLSRLPAPAVWAFVAAYGAANLRVGAQLPWLPGARYFLLVAMVLAVAALVLHWRDRSRTRSPRVSATDERPVSDRDRRTAIRVLAANTVVLCAACIVMADVSLHRRVEGADGLNKWGYRGPVARPRRPDEARVAIVGGQSAYGSGVPLDESFPFYLQRNMRQGWRKLHATRPVSVLNLATPVDDLSSFADTVADYAYLQPDVFVFVIDHSMTPPAAPEGPGWRRQSPLFRATGYMPLITWAFPTTSAHASASGANGDSRAVGETVMAAVDAAVARGCRALVVTAPFRSADDPARERAFAARLTERFGGNARVRYLNLGTAVDLHDAVMSRDGTTLTARGHDAIAERLTDRVLELVRQ